MEQLKHLQVPLIVAINDLSGAIGSRKVSHEFAEFLQCPLVDENDITPTPETISSPTISAASNDAAVDSSFGIICRIALTQLSLKFNVVVVNMQCNNERLHKLEQLQHSGKARSVIIQPKTIYHQDHYLYDDGGPILKSQPQDLRIPVV
ncbi:uncharacterized protein LOC105633535 [Jatropha curcas]|uniref:uncharacterized protein LOC105633535 n=1 Tax=Jatropha curcas TaxID=180498 RepID=UPI0005FBD81D|nr:uncharacterized protein LOC105633535 [Jatropha curcas]